MDPFSETAEARRASVLFVCLGNICRSPLAEGVTRHLAGELGLGDRIRIESAGTGSWHVGEAPDPRSREVARRNGVSLDGQRARRVAPEDLHEFDLVVAMDRSNLDALEALVERHGGSARLALLRDFDPEPGDGEVPDPYYGGPDGFDRVYEMVRRSCRRLLDEFDG
jgi:protein-tyrosine phosphatase